MGNKCKSNPKTDNTKNAFLRKKALIINKLVNVNFGITFRIQSKNMARV